MTANVGMTKVKDLHSFTCPLCLEVFENPCKIPCDHSFCSKCLDQFASRPSLACPLCRQSFEKRQIDVDIVLYERLRRHCVDCEGCRQMVVLNNIRSHMASCDRLKALNESRVNSTKIKASPEMLNMPNRQTFKCPYCSQDHFDQSGLVDHCLNNHRQSPQLVICPICASMPWGDPEQVSSNFMAHLTSRHRFDYATYVDYEQDEDTVLNATILASLKDQ